MSAHTICPKCGEPFRGLLDIDCVKSRVDDDINMVLTCSECGGRFNASVAIGDFLDNPMD